MGIEAGGAATEAAGAERGRAAVVTVWVTNQRRNPEALEAKGSQGDSRNRLAHVGVAAAEYTYCGLFLRTWQNVRRC